MALDRRGKRGGLYDGLPCAAALLDAAAGDGPTVAEANPAWTVLFGAAGAEGSPLATLAPSLRDAAAAARLAEALAGGAPLSLIVAAAEGRAQLLVSVADGRPVALAMAIPAAETDGGARTIAAPGRGPKRARRRSRARPEQGAGTAAPALAERRFVDAMEALPDGFVLFDAEDRLVICNSRYRAVYDRSRDAIAPGARFEDVVRAGLAAGQYPGAAGREAAFLDERLALHARAEGAAEQALPGDRWVRLIERRTASGDTVGLRIDVSDFKRQQRDLREARIRAEAAATELAEASALVERFFELSLDLMGVTDAAGRFLRVNAAWARTLGWPTERLLGASFADFVHPDDLAATSETRDAVAAGRRVDCFINRFRAAGGGWRTLEWRAARAEDGCIHFVARDVTAREADLRRRTARAAEEAALAGLMRLALETDAAEDFGAAALDLILDGTPWLGPERSGALFLGAPGPEGGGLRLAATRGPAPSVAAGCADASAAGGSCFAAAAAEALRGGGGEARACGANVVAPIRRSEEALGVLVLRLPPAQDPEAAPLTFLSRAADALALGLSSRAATARLDAERRRACAALEELRSYQAALDAHAIVSVTDPRGVITAVNRNFCEISGFAEDELIGRSHRVVNSGTHPPGFFGEMWASIGAGRPWRGDVCNRRRDGSLYWVDATVIPVRDGDGRISRHVAVRHDITERKRLSEALAMANQRLATIARSAGVGGWSWDAATGAVTLDPLTCAIHDAPEGATLTLERALSCYDASDRSDLAARWDACRTRGEPVDIELPFTSLEGRRRWVRGTAVRIVEGGRTVGVVGSLQDVTERRAREIETEALRARFEAIFENTGQVMFLKARDGRFLAANRRFRDQLGVAEVAGRTDRDFAPPEIADAFAATEAEVFRSGAPVTLEETVVRPDGGRRHFVSSKFLIRDGAEGDDVLCCVATDVTELRERETEIESLRARFEAIFEQSDATIYLKRQDGSYIAGNRHLAAQLGGDFVGKRNADFLPIDEARLFTARDRAVFETGSMSVTEEVARGDDGATRDFLTARFLIHDPVLGEEILCVISSDITPLKRLQASLEDSRRAAEQASRAKSDFLATMSHEIRTPLNGVIGMAELLAPRLSDPENRRMLDVIRDSGAVLLAVINDVLDFSKIEAGRLELETIPFAPAEIARRVVALHAARAASKGLRLRIDAAPGAETPRLGDPTRVQQALHNLVGNAIKFTEAGEVVVRLGGAPGEALTIEVRDSGPGMTSEQAARAFEPFGQADSSTTRRHGGTGLGLPIVKRLAEAMGGAFAIETAPGAGLTARLRLPLAAAQAAASPEPPAEPSAIRPGLRVLAADDNEINRMVLGGFLDSLGVRHVLVDGGREAVAAAASGGFDLLLLDISMPDMDGTEALAAIRAGEIARGAPRIPAMAVTANAMAHQVQAFLAAGFDAHLAKPIRREELIERLIRLDGRAGAATPLCKPPAMV